MIYEFKHPGDGGKLRLIESETVFRQNYFDQAAGFNTHTIAWNRGASQQIVIDEIPYTFDRNAVIPLMLNQSFYLQEPSDVVLLQFNREFYCIVNHDAEVGCVGFLFFGPSPVMSVTLDEAEAGKIAGLIDLFRQEMTGDDTAKASMLRMLLVQYIIGLTRLLKKQYMPAEPTEDQFNLIRQYNLLVEVHFRKEKQVKFYAGLLHRSPKTLSNIFARYSKRTPVEIIHERVVTEAKRLIYYTDKSVKEIASELGFEDVSHFSKFIKGYTSLTPTQLKSAREQA